MKKTRIFLFLAMLLLVSVSLFASSEDAITKSKESFRVELGAGANLNTNFFVIGAPHMDATARVSFLDDKLGIIGGVEYFNDLWFWDGLTTFQRMNYVVGLSLYNFNLTCGLNNDDGKVNLASLRLNYNWKVLEEKKGHFLYGVGLRAGLESVISMANLSGGTTAQEQAGQGFSNFFSILFSLIPRVSVGGTVKIGTAF